MVAPERTRNQGADVEDAYAVEGERDCSYRTLFCLCLQVLVIKVFPQQIPSICGNFGSLLPWFTLDD